MSELTPEEVTKLPITNTTDIPNRNFSKKISINFNIILCVCLCNFVFQRYEREDYEHWEQLILLLAVVLLLMTNSKKKVIELIIIVL